MTPDQQRLIDIRMFVEYRSKPVGEWTLNVESADSRVRPYLSPTQRLWVEFRPDTGVIAVYSFAAEFKV